MDEFESLDYFEFNPGMVFAATLQVHADAAIEIAASTGSTSKYRVAGEVLVPFPDEVRGLVALQGEEDEMFIPFSDLTCGRGSYGGGRYVSPILQPDGTLLVDFNRAINPYCAYDPEFSCPLPPPGNRVPLSVDAGEKDYT